MKTLALILLLLIPLNAIAADEWTKETYVLEAAFVILHVIDWGQTLSIVGDDNYEELNPLVGESPSRGRVNLFGFAILIGHSLVTHYLPDEYRPYWQYSTIVVKGFSVAHNYSIGVTVDF